MVHKLGFHHMHTWSQSKSFFFENFGYTVDMDWKLKIRTLFHYPNFFMSTLKLN